MMFDEVVSRVDLGCKILAGHLVACRFGPKQAQSLVFISQTLDKLIIHDCTLACRTTSSPVLSTTFSKDDQHQKSLLDAPLGDLYTNNISGQSVYYIAIKDVIKTISVHSFKVLNSPEAVKDDNKKTMINTIRQQQTDELNTDETSSISLHDRKTLHSINDMINSTIIIKDLLLIGCSNSVLIYDATSQTILANIITASSIDAITGGGFKLESTTCVTNSSLAICAGPHKIYALKFESLLHQTGFNNLNNSTISAELSSERSTGDIVTCLIQGIFSGLDLVLSGSVEQKIRAYQLDSFDLNIQTCKLTIEESAQVNCLCAINTLVATKCNEKTSDSKFTSTRTLPPVHDTSQPLTITRQCEEMNYFAYGLENGFLGVYQLFYRPSTTNDERGKILSSERVWRHKCKYPPTTILMYDINGDGQDELVVGYKNSRIEARSPFTGQLLAATRCFKSDRLTGLQVIDYNNDGTLTLLACSTNGLLNTYKPSSCKPRIPLKGYYTTNLQLETVNGALEDEYKNLDDESSLMLMDQCKNATAESSADTLKTIGLDYDSKATNICGPWKTLKAESETFTNLHIETHRDNQKASKCDARQSYDLLLKLNTLYTEQMELEKKACQSYNKNVYRNTSLNYPVDLHIEHRWDFDSTSVCLKLTIVVIGTKMDNIKLIELRDESKNYLTRGYLLVNPLELNNCKSTQAADPHKSQVVVIPMRSQRNVRTKLDLKVFCESIRVTAATQNTSSDLKVARIFSKSIDVPRFSMIILAPKLDDKNHESQKKKKLIRFTFKLRGRKEVLQVLDWLNENFLCFQFGRLIKSNNSSWIESNTTRDYSSYPESTSSKNSQSHPNLALDSNGNFELNLLDVRHHILNRSVNLIQNNSYDDLDRKQTTFKESKEQLTRSYSTLRVAYLLSDYDGKRGGRGSSAGGGILTLECENSDLAVDLIQSLVIDRLQVYESLSAGKGNQEDEFEVDVEPILDELNKLTETSRQLEESEKRIQTELYEAADHTKTLMQQFVISNELNEYNTSKELLNELFMMLNGTQNAARAQCLNNRSRVELSKKATELRIKVDFLTGKHQIY